MLWFGHDFRFEIVVPVIACEICQDTFTVDPVSVGCFPGSPVEAWDVSRAPVSHMPIWFALDLVTNLEAASNDLRRFSVVTWASWIEGIHKRNLCGHAKEEQVAPDRLRRCLGDAIRELGYQLFALDASVVAVEGYPSGPFSDCGGCWRAGLPCEFESGKQEEKRPLHSAFADGNFKVPHLRNQSKQKITEDASLPPNHKKFVPNLEVMEFMDATWNTVARDTSKTCSDFEADAELGRQSKVYDITGIMGLFCHPKSS